MVLRVTGAVKTWIQTGMLDQARHPVGRDGLLSHISAWCQLAAGLVVEKAPFGSISDKSNEHH